MVYLICNQHRSYQRKHIDVCRKCADNDDCNAYLEYCATEPPAPLETVPPRGSKFQIPVRELRHELLQIRSLVSDRGEPQNDHGKVPKKAICHEEQLADVLKTELEGIKELCSRP